MLGRVKNPLARQTFTISLLFVVRENCYGFQNLIDPRLGSPFQADIETKRISKHKRFDRYIQMSVCVMHMSVYVNPNIDRDV